MRAAAVVFLVLISSAFAQSAPPANDTDGLRIELRTSSNRVKMTEEMVVTVFFRSPEKEITIWNALAWGAPAGLYLQVLDSSGREVRNEFAPFFHPLPPDLTGKRALLSIEGRVFAGFDDKISVKVLFPKPGKYTLRCHYDPPLPRHYFQGHTIWGKEDGPINSVRVPVLVDE